MWKDFQQIYDGFGLVDNLCIKDPSSIKIKGSNPLGKIQYFLIRVTKLTNID